MAAGLSLQGRPDCRRQQRSRPSASARCRAQDRSGWLTGKRCGISSTVARMCSIRGRARNTGEDARNRARSGHLPGARHLSHVDLLENGLVRPAAALHAMLERVGFGPGDHIVTHCEGGGGAALGAAAAVRAGFADVRVYYLSFGDWVRDESCPVVRD